MIGFCLIIITISGFKIQPSFAFSSEADIFTAIHKSNGEGESITIEFSLINFAIDGIKGFYYIDNISSNFELHREWVEINGDRVECLQVFQTADSRH